MSISQARRIEMYGPPEADSANKQTVTMPAGVDLSYGDGKIQTVWAHDLMVEHFTATLHAAIAAIPADSSWEMRRCDSWVARKISGSSNWSMHSWALAWDIFATDAVTPPPGGVWTPYAQVPAEFVAVFEQAGFTWGGRWNRQDTPHFEWGEEPPAGAPADPPAVKMVAIEGVQPQLSKGSYGAAVSKMQALLLAHDPGRVIIWEGYRDDFIDGVFGEDTQGALRRWQQVRGITVDGICGVVSWTELVFG